MIDVSLAHDWDHTCVFAFWTALHGCKLHVLTSFACILIAIGDVQLGAQQCLAEATSLLGRESLDRTHQGLHTSSEHLLPVLLLVQVACCF